MSIKLYNGSKLPLMSLIGLHEFINGIREKTTQKAYELACCHIAETSVHIVDQLAVGIDVKYKNEPLTDSPFFVAQLNMMDRQREIEKSNKRDSKVDFESSVCLFPLSDKILALFYAERPELVEIWMGNSVVSEYGYWNNTDRPDEVSEKQWRQRSIDWDNTGVTEYGIVPAMKGLTASLSNNLIVPTLDDCLKYVPTLEKRTWSVAFECLCNARAKSDDDDQKRVDLFIHMCRYIKTDEGKREMEEEQKRVQNLLPEINQKALLKECHNT